MPFWKWRLTFDICILNNTYDQLFFFCRYQSSSKIPEFGWKFWLEFYQKIFRISKFINVAFFTSPDLKIAFDLRGEKIITGNKIQDSRTWKSGSKYSALLRGGAEGGFSPTPLNYGDQKREQIEKKDNLLLLFFVWGPRICPS